MNSPRKQQGNTVFNSYPDLPHQPKQLPTQPPPKEETPPSPQVTTSPLGSAKPHHRTNKILSYKERSPLTEKKREKVFTKQETQ